MHIFRMGEITTILHRSCAYIAHWRKKYNLAQIFCIYCASEKEVQSCAYIAHWERIFHKSCEYIAHWRRRNNLVQILHIYCTSGKEVQTCTNLVLIFCIGRESCTNLEYILHIGERSTILRESFAYIAHWRKKYKLVQNLSIYCTLEK